MARRQAKASLNACRRLLFGLLLWRRVECFCPVRFVSKSTTESPGIFHRSTLLHAKKDATKLVPLEESFNVQLNEFFKKPVPEPIRQYLSIHQQDQNPSLPPRQADLLTAPPSDPGVPRPLWLVILASVPTGLLWYGYYKFAVEEELMHQELKHGQEPRGFGGYGTLGPFVYGCLLGPLAFILHLPGGLQWTNLGILFIYYTQFLLYDRVNQLYKEQGLQEPLAVWWCLPIFFPFDLIVGLRQVHFLSQYWYRQGGFEAPVDPVVELFPFIGAPRFTWQEFLTTPSLWCRWFAAVDKIDRSKLPAPVQQVLAIGESSRES